MTRDASRIRTLLKRTVGLSTAAAAAAVLPAGVAGAVTYINYATNVDENPKPHWINSSTAHQNPRIGGIVQNEANLASQFFVWGQTVAQANGLPVADHAGLGYLEYTDPVTDGYSRCQYQSIGALFPTGTHAGMTCFYTKK